MRFSAVAASALLLCPDDSLLHVGGATETVAFPPSPVDQAAYQELLVSRMFGPANSRFEGMPRPPPPGAPLGYGRDLEALRTMTRADVVAAHASLFRGLPREFDRRFRNPCWFSRAEDSGGSGSAARTGGTATDTATASAWFQCLPHGVVLGFPKCATSDLWERLTRHPEVASSGSGSKETRFFSQGEMAARSPPGGWVGAAAPLWSWTGQFAAAAQLILQRQQGEQLRQLRQQQQRRQERQQVVLEGGPHTAWWPTQRPDYANRTAAYYSSYPSSSASSRPPLVLSRPTAVCTLNRGFGWNVFPYS